MFMNLINSFLFRPFFFFDAGDGGGGGDPDPQKTPEQIAQEKKDQEDADAQKKLDQQFAERATRAAEAERAKILKELGVKDPAEAKTLVEAARKADDASKDALTKAEEARQAAETKAQEAEAAAKTAGEAATQKLMNADIKLSAASPVMDKDGKKVIRPAFRKDALDDVLLLIDRKNITEKDGNFDGVEKALDTLAKAKPYLLESEADGKRRSTPNDRDRKPRSGDEDEKRTRIITGL